MHENLQPNLVLVGFMGTGKTVVGAQLAKRLGWPFVDTDALIEQAAGMSIPRIFATRGEVAFRAQEREVCKQVADKARTVIATGGGILLDLANRDALQEHGVLVLLTADPAEIARRLWESADHEERPLLGADPAGRVEELLRERAPVYSSVSFKVDTTGLSHHEVGDRVLELYASVLRRRMNSCP